jgi:predicted TIM-barrel fold metal-dependent hydrolase
VIDALGPDFVMYASDYPHWDGEFPESTRALRSRADLSDTARRKVLGENAVRFYGLSSLSGPAQPPPAGRGGISYGFSS